MLFAVAILFISCEKDAFFSVPEGNSVLFAFSEISPNDKVVVNINTSIGVNSDDYFYYPKQSEAEIKLFESGVELEELRFRYSISDGAFVSQGKFRPVAGLEYAISVRLKNNDEIKPIFGKTIIPNYEELSEVNVFEYIETATIDNFKKFSISADINFSNLNNNYFILKPKYIEESGEMANLSLTKILKGAEGAKFSNCVNGILVNTIKTNGKLSIQLESSDSIASNHQINFVDFELISITEEAYNYYKAFSVQIQAQSSILSEPVISFSNFENGLGLFSGTNSSYSTFRIKK